LVKRCERFPVPEHDWDQCFCNFRLELAGFAATKTYNFANEV
jgi:hypothetical protein